jgi:hypothetical protein
VGLDRCVPTADLVGSYAFYLPTGVSPLAGGKGLSAGHVTHEFSAGGSLFANKKRTSFLSALASYDRNLRKRGIDVTRGDTFQIQGGAGVSRFNRVLEAGLAGHGLWQVHADHGADLPLALQGARDSAYGLGPEAALTIKSLRSQIRIRYELAKRRTEHAPPARTRRLALGVKSRKTNTN